jgi:hypothetical protein
MRFKEFITEEDPTDRPVTRDDFIVEGPTNDGLWYIGIKDFKMEGHKPNDKFYWQLEAMRSAIRFGIDILGPFGYDLDAYGTKIELYTPSFQNSKAIAFPITRWHHIPDVPALVIAKPVDAILKMSDDNPEIARRVALKKKKIIDRAIERMLADGIDIANDSRKRWNNPLDDE